MKNIWALSSVVLKESIRRKDFYVLFVVTAVITLIMGSVNLFHDRQIDRYMKEICLLLIWISSLVIAITMAARQIPTERESRTIYPLLAKPISRTEVLLAKFLGCWLANAVALAAFYVFFGLMAMSKEHHWPLANYFQAVWLHWIMLGVIIAMCLLGSLLFSAISANVTISFVAVTFILLIGRHLDQVAMQAGEPWRTLLMGIFFVIPHLEFFDVRDLVIHNWPSIHCLVCFKATAYGAIYGAFILTAACLVFRRRALN
jgi:ABC-type transport system involved in multi-copper enzyme maturation permease subunit